MKSILVVDDEPKITQLVRDYLEREKWWLDQYAVFRALHTEHKGRHWIEWETPLRDRDGAGRIFVTVDFMKSRAAAPVTGVEARQVADTALKAGVSVYGIQEEKVDLERLFFQLTSGQYAGYAPAPYKQQQGGWA